MSRRGVSLSIVTRDETQSSLDEALRLVSQMALENKLYQDLPVWLANNWANLSQCAPAIGVHIGCEHEEETDGTGLEAQQQVWEHHLRGGGRGPIWDGPDPRRQEPDPGAPGVRR